MPGRLWSRSQGRTWPYGSWTAASGPASILAKSSGPTRTKAGNSSVGVGASEVRQACDTLLDWGGQSGMGVLGSDRATELGGLRAIVLVQRFFLDPLGALSSLEGSHGGFVRINLPLSFGNLPREVVFVAKPRQYREILGRPDIWRTVSIGAASKHHHASARLGNGIVRMRGKRHAHYRKLIVPPLRREAVAALSGDMERVAERAVDTWPVDAPFDLWARVRGLMQEAAVTHLFGAEPGLAMPVAGQITALAEGSFSLAINAFPFDLPGTPFARTMRSADT